MNFQYFVGHRWVKGVKCGFDLKHCVGCAKYEMNRLE